MANLTAMECLMLGEHFKSEKGILQLLQFASQNCSEPRCKNLCKTMLQEHQQQFRNLARYIEQ